LFNSDKYIAATNANGTLIFAGAGFLRPLAPAPTVETCR
jgi:hypothetical protein